MADTQNPGTQPQQPGPVRQPYLPQDPISFILMVPLLPLMFLMQSLSSMMIPAGLRTSSAIPAMPMMAQSSSNQYKNNEEWEIWEEGGKLKVRVHRDARRV